MLEAGARAPNLELETLEGGRFELAEQLSRGSVALVFFKISCPTCQFTLPFLERLYASAQKGGPALFGVSQDKPEATRDFSQHFGIRFPVILDKAEEKFPASNAYRITNVPSLFLIEADGRIAWALNGFHKQELEELGKRFGRSPFLQDEHLPASRPG